MSEGTLTSGFPLESTTVTVDPSLRLVPATGFWDTTEPAATVIDVTGAPVAKVIWSLVTSARAWATGRLTRAGVGCEGVKTLASKAAASPPATMTTSAIGDHDPPHPVAAP